MICPACGAYNEEGRALCVHCNTPLAPAAAPVGAAAYGQAPAPAAGPGFGTAAPDPYGAPGSYGAPPVMEGCVSAAWRDVRATPGWFGKLLLLGLINLVPVLNFVVQGYGLQWAREAAFGRRGDMPKAIFADRTFSVGFFALAIAVIFGFAFGLAGGLFGMVTLGIGSVVLPVLWVFFVMFLNACVMRMAVVGRFGAAFELSKAWAAYKRSLGALFCASVVPNIIAMLLLTLVVILVTLLVTALGIGGISVSGSSSARLFGVPLMGGMIVVLTVAAVLGMVVYAFAEIVKYRALGHWVARTAPEWVYEAEAPFGYGAPYASVPGAMPPSYPPASPYAPSASEAYVPPVVPPEPVTPSGMPMPHAAGYGAPEPTQPSAYGAAPEPALSYAPAPAPVAPPRDEGTTRLDQPQAYAPLSLTLVRASGERLIVTDFPATVGKGSAANVRIDGNSAVSRAHVRIALSGASFMVEDLGATNGTFLNGSPLSEGEFMPLADGDELRLADEVLTVVTG